MSLVISRHVGESIFIGDNIEVYVAKISDGRVRLSIAAPREIEVHRREIWDRIQQQKGAANATD